MVKIGILYDCSSHGDDDNFCEQASAIKWIGLKDGNIRYLCTCKQPFDDPLIGTPCTSLQKMCRMPLTPYLGATLAART